MKKSILSLLVLALIALVVMSVQAQELMGYTNDSTWENLQSGTIVNAQVTQVPPALFLEPSEDAERLENTFQFGASITVREHYLYWNVGHIFRVRVVNSSWVEVIPQTRRSSPYGSRTVYAQTQYLRLLLPREFEPILIGAESHDPDRLIVVVKNDFSITAFVGGDIQLRTWVRMGPNTPVGDHRTFIKMLTSDMPGTPGVPWPNGIGEGIFYHGAPWWAGDEIAHGSNGSHGCINLPGEDWYPIQYRGETMGVAEWLWRWDANMNHDPVDQSLEYSYTDIPYDQRRFQAVDATRVIIVDSIWDLYNYSLTKDLGELSTSASVQSWEEIIDAYIGVGDNWLLTHVAPDGTISKELIPTDITPAEKAGRTVESPYVMLACDDVAHYDDPAYPGSSRRMGSVCHHLRVERNNSICTPERVDLDYLGKIVLCDGPRFNAATLIIRGELIEHENIHLAQFGAYFGDLVRQGIAADDLTPNWTDYRQVSLIGVTELMAQMMNVGSVLDEDYFFVLVSPSESGGLRLISDHASTLEAWQHLHNECGDRDGQSTELDSLITSALYGNATAYQELQAQCSLPLYQLVPDRRR